MSLRGRDIVCVGIADWHNDLQTNDQHLLRRLAGENRILFVESLGLRQPQLAGRDLSRIWRRLRNGVRPPRLEEGVNVLSPLVLPFHSHALVRAINRWLLPLQVTRAARRLDFRDVLLWSFVPQAEVLIDALRPSQILYYIDDDHGAKPGIDAASFDASERAFAQRADVVMASAPALADKLAGLNDNVHLAPNVADTRLFATALQDGPVDPALQRLDRPRIAFTGAIVADKLDLPLIIEMCSLRPQWSFAFFGPRGPGDPHTDVSALTEVANLSLLGARRYEDLPSALRGADVAILPYRTDGAMRSVFPMKTFEYLAAGLPVVSTRLPALTDMLEVAGEIAFAVTADEMVAQIEAAMSDDDDDRRARRSSLALGHSWESRIEQIATLLAR
jgi:glycosyltransferase involved in cell wall biosynthesis